MPEGSIVLLGCGDVGPIHDPVDAYSVPVRSTLSAADIRFAHCERLYSENGTRQSAGMEFCRLKPHMASVFSDCGFDVVSLAGNHALDWGITPLLDTIALFQKKGIKTAGAGSNSEEARRPAIIDKNGVRVAFLAYCSILREAYEAGPNKPGIAPLRVHTYYEPVEYQAGFPPRIVTVPYEEDLAAMVEDIAKAKQTAHVVVLSLHWGVHDIPRMIADYQPIVAQAAFKAGADLILGHHAPLKAIEVCDGKACFYSVSDFIRVPPPKKLPPDTKTRASFSYADYATPAHNSIHSKQRCVIAKAILSREGVKKVSFLPVQIDEQTRPEIVHRDDPRFDDAVNFMEWASQGFNHKFVVEDDEVIVTE